MSNDKSAEEIVQGLRCCNKPRGHRCSECPVFSRYAHGVCKATVDRLAADLIESQAAEIAELRAQFAAQYAKYSELQRYNTDCTKQCGALLVEKFDLQAQLAASQQRERAAVEDLKISAFCQTCRERCSLTESLSRRSFGACKHYEWRGPQEAGKEPAKQPVFDNCPVCGCVVSNLINTCPRCGHPIPIGVQAGEGERDRK